MSYIEPQIKRYIDQAVEKSVSEIVVEVKEVFRKEADHHAGLLRESFSDQVKLLAEGLNSKPGREEVREIIRDEFRPIVMSMNIFKEEIRALRLDSNNLEKRLTRLQRAAA